MKKIPLVLLALLLTAGCATTSTPEPPSASINPANAGWLLRRDAYYRSLGWSTLDAREQAERDLAQGKSSPVEHAHMSRGRVLTTPN